MKDEKAEPNKEAAELNQQPTLKELQESHQILEALISTLPAQTKKELVDLLQTLAKSDESQETNAAVHQRALEIVSDICKPNSLKEIEGQERNERRQHDRRLK